MKWAYKKKFIYADDAIDWINEHQDVDIISITCQFDEFYIFYWVK